ARGAFPGCGRGGAGWARGNPGPPASGIASSRGSRPCATGGGSSGCSRACPWRASLVAWRGCSVAAGPATSASWPGGRRPTRSRAAAGGGGSLRGLGCGRRDRVRDHLAEHGAVALPRPDHLAGPWAAGFDEMLACELEHRALVRLRERLHPHHVEVAACREGLRLVEYVRDPVGHARGEAAAP